MLDSVENTADAYQMRLRAGASYRVNAAMGADRCAALAIYGPGTISFVDATPVRRGPRDGYVLFTPDRAGTYSLLVSATPRLHVRQPYRLRVARARPDDTAPGLELRNFGRARGSLGARGIDVVDLYRFDVTTRSELTLTLSTPGSPAFDVVLLSDGGRRISSARSEGGADLSRRLTPGRYFAAARARPGAHGRYALRRVSRTIPSTRISIAGGRAQSPPGAAVTVAVDLTPAVAGPVTVVIERCDPLAGWQFLRRVRTRATSGHAAVGFSRPRRGITARSQRARARPKRPEARAASSVCRWPGRSGQ